MKNDLIFKKTIVVGAGAMGIGIAQVLSQAGATVFLYDIDLAGVKKALEKLEKVMERLVVKGRLERLESREILKRITPIEALEKAEGAQVVIEAISENIELKRDLFQKLEDLLPADTIFATNTSSLSIASLAKGLNHPERLIGIHFFNPAALMPLVEIIPSMATGPEIVSDCKSWLTQMGKSPVVAKDSPGFIVNRVARAFYGEAMNIYEEGIASPDTIDWAMTSLGKFKMGPFLLMDFIGQDINYSVSESVWTQFYFEPRFRPNISQKRLVDQGWLGRKSGRGFYTYEEGSAVSSPIKDEVLGNSILERILALLINEALSALGDRLCTLEDLETAMVKGVNYPIGLIEWAKKNRSR
jgi:3-hydroxybutyryl-CoA dehydrogenase